MHKSIIKLIPSLLRREGAGFCTALSLARCTPSLLREGGGDEFLNRALARGPHPWPLS